MLSIWMASAICGNPARRAWFVFGDRDVVGGVGAVDVKRRQHDQALYAVLHAEVHDLCEPTTLRSKRLPADSLKLPVRPRWKTASSRLWRNRSSIMVLL